MAARGPAHGLMTRLWGGITGTGFIQLYTVESEKPHQRQYQDRIDPAWFEYQ